MPCIGDVPREAVALLDMASETQLWLARRAVVWHRRMLCGVEDEDLEGNFEREEDTSELGDLVAMMAGLWGM